MLCGHLLRFVQHPLSLNLALGLSLSALNISCRIEKHSLQPYCVRPVCWKGREAGMRSTSEVALRTIHFSSHDANTAHNPSLGNVPQTGKTCDSSLRESVTPTGERPVDIKQIFPYPIIMELVQPSQHHTIQVINRATAAGHESSACMIWHAESLPRKR